MGDKGDAKRKAADEMLRILMHRAQELGVYAPQIKENAAIDQQSVNNSQYTNLFI